jgi:hypothetical protein
MESHRRQLVSFHRKGCTPFLGLIAGQLVLIAGCSSNSPEVAPVRGVVEFDGKPLSGFQYAAVAFTPEAGRPAKGTVSTETGAFELTTYAAGDGARIGRHAVAVSATVDDPKAQTEDKYPGVRFVIPEKFSKKDMSGLVYEVKPGDNRIRIQIRSDGTGAIVAE